LLPQLQQAHREWVEAGSSADIAQPDDHWSDPIAVGSEGFVEQVKNELGLRKHREVSVADGLCTLRKPVPPYGDHFNRGSEALRPNNTVSW
jgi:putative transposase